MTATAELSGLRAAARISVLGAALAFMGTSVWASPASEAIQALTTHGSYTREVRLSALGVVEPVALLKESVSRDFYFPMPRSNVTDARIHFSGRTHKMEEGRTGVILSVNGIPQYT